MDTHYEYALDWSKGSKRNHLDGERAFVERYIRLVEFDARFYAQYRGKIDFRPPRSRVDGRKPVSVS